MIYVGFYLSPRPPLGDVMGELGKEVVFDFLLIVLEFGNVVVCVGDARLSFDSVFRLLPLIMN